MPLVYLLDVTVGSGPEIHNNFQVWRYTAHKGCSGSMHSRIKESLPYILVARINDVAMRTGFRRLYVNGSIFTDGKM